MERADDERLTTRDIASPNTADDPRFEREDEAARDARGTEVTHDTMATMADPAATTDARAAEPDTDLRAADGAGDGRTADADGDQRRAGDDRDVRAREPEADVLPADTSATADTGTETGAVAATADSGATTGGTGSDPADNAPLLPDSDDFQRRWEEIQVRFVDEPRGAVEDADALVATVMQRLAEGFAQERDRLEGQWGRGEDISTEDLRVALQRYRSFFQRLLAT
jgi:hypothetical protein